MTCRYPYSGGVRVLVDQAAQDEQHGVHVQEVGGEDSAGLGVQELPPGRACASRCRVDARGMQDLPRWTAPRRCRVSSARRGCGGIPTVDSPSPGERRGVQCPRTAGLAPLLVSYFLAAILRCQASSVASVTGDDIGPAPAGYEPCQRGEPHPVGRLVPHPASMAAQHCVLVPEHQQFSILRQVLTEYQDSQAE
jgi:hypothetical protein